MTNLEQTLNEKLRSNPKLKKTLKRIYQKSMYYTHAKVKSAGELIRITPQGRECFFGYYDKCPWNASGRYMLGLQVKNASTQVAPTEPCEILLIDTQNNYKNESIATSHTWNVQQGCMLQWLGPDFENKIIYNDFIDGKYQSVVMDIETRQKRVYEYPIYSVAASGKYALGLDFSRLHRMRPGYGYSNLPDRTEKQLCPDQTCITKINLHTGEIIPLITYAQLAEISPRKEMDGAEHKVNHIMINPSATRFMVLHRWIINNKKYTRLLTMDMDGKNPYVLSDDDMVSHCCWKNDGYILAWARKKDFGNGYYLMQDKSQTYEIKWAKKLQTDGHPSYSPNGSLIVTDCYPNHKRIASVFLADTKKNVVHKEALVFSPFKYDNDTRCDLHPRWNRTGTKICIDSVHEGYRGMYLMPVKETKIKVLYIVSTLRDTGPTNQLYGIIRHLDQTVFEPHILTLSQEPKDSKMQLFLDSHISVTTLGLCRKAYLLHGHNILKREIGKIKPDLIHTSGIRPDVTVSKLHTDIPQCSSIRNYIYEDYTLKFGGLKGTVMAQSHGRAMKNITYPVCCSKTLQEMYHTLFKKRFYAIQNGVNIQKYHICTEAEKNELRQKNHLDIGKKILVVAGSLIPRKDPLTILQAFEQVKQKKECILLFLGDGPLKEKCLKFQADNIRFWGHVTNVNEYLQLADGFISASLSEGLPNTVLEAGASGLPMLLSDIPQHREILEKEMPGIRFFAKKNTAQLAVLMETWISELEHTDTHQIQTYVAENFDMQATSKKYQMLYAAMLKGEGLHDI